MASPGGAVLIVALSKRYGGSAVRVLQTAGALDGNLPYAVAALQGSPLHAMLVERNLNVIPFRFSRGDPRLGFALRRTIRNGDFRVVDAHNPQSQFWGLLAARSCGVASLIATIHGQYGPSGPGIRGRLYEWVIRLNASWNCRFVAVSESVKAYLQGLGVSEAQIRLIHNGIDLTDAGPPFPRHALRELFGWERETFVVSSVGRLEPVKGHDVLIDAMQQVMAERPRVRCLLIGEGRCRRSLEDKVKRLGLAGRVHFTGFRTDVRSLLSASDAFCMPSLSEGLPYALLEACMERVPAVVTAVGDMGLLLRDGETAVVVPPGAPRALAEGIRFLMDNAAEAARRAEGAASVVRERLSREAMMNETIGLYQGR